MGSKIKNPRERSDSAGWGHCGWGGITLTIHKEVRKWLHLQLQCGGMGCLPSCSTSSSFPFPWQIWLRFYALFLAERPPWDRIRQRATDGACLFCLSRKRPSPTRNAAAPERLEALKYQRIKKPKKPSKGSSKSKKQISECEEHETPN